MELDRIVIKLWERGTAGVELFTTFVLHTVFTVYLCKWFKRGNKSTPLQTHPLGITATDPWKCHVVYIWHVSLNIKFNLFIQNVIYSSRPTILLFISSFIHECAASPSFPSPPLRVPGPSLPPSGGHIGMLDVVEAGGSRNRRRERRKREILGKARQRVRGGKGELLLLLGATRLN